MTIKSVKDEDSMHWQVIDLDTGDVLRGVQYSNDETGLYIQRQRTERGAISRVITGANIKLEDKRERYSPPSELDPLPVDRTIDNQQQV